MCDEYRVLLVDDEMEFVTTLAERLETRGMKAVVADSGEEAIEKASVKSFDAIILDLAMPGMDGLETLRRLRELNADLQVILLTGRATVRQGIEAMKSGALDVVEKPADIRELVAKIEEAAAKKMQLTADRIDQQVVDIVGKKGW